MACLAGSPHATGSDRSGAAFSTRIVHLGGSPSDPAVAAHVEFAIAAGFNAVWIEGRDAGRFGKTSAPTGAVLDPAFVTLAGRLSREGIRVFLSIDAAADRGDGFRYSARGVGRRMRSFVRLVEKKTGVRDFVLSFEGQPTALTDGEDIVRFGLSAAPAHLALAREVIRTGRDGSRFWILPAAASDEGLEQAGALYTEPFLEGLRALPGSVGVVWNGPSRFPARITAEDVETARARLGGRPLLLQDNFPRNDDDERDAIALVLAPLKGRDPALATLVAGYLARPMTELGASRLSLLTIADYLSAPDLYDPAESWKRHIAALAGDDGEALEALRTQTLEWGGFIGERNYHRRDHANPGKVARSLHDPAFVSSFSWTRDRYPDRMDAILGVADEPFRDDVIEVMAARLAIGRAIPPVREYIARRNARRSDVADILATLRRMRSEATLWPRALRSLDRFLEAAGVPIPAAS